MTRVAPQDGGEDGGKKEQAYEGTYEEQNEGFWAWAKARWWVVALGTLLVCGIIVAVIVGPVCGVRGCPPKHTSPQSSEPTGPSRLIVNFKLPDLDALDVIPAILRQYTSRLKLDSSLLQILDFVDEDVLLEARKYLQAHPELEFLVRDWAMSTFPNVTSGNGTWDASTLNISAILGGDTSTVDGLLDGLGIDISTDSGGGGTRRAGRRLSQTTTTAGVVMNDPYIQNGTEWHIRKVQAPLAWTVTRGSADVIVAVLDTGFQLDHPDLLANLWVNKKEIAGNGVDDDGNGFIDDINGWDFAGACKAGTANTGTTSCLCQGRNVPLPYNRHGTHVAGLIGAVANNSRGTAGMAPNIKLMLLRVADCVDGSIYSSSVVTALDYALKMGAHIISMSIGMNYPWSFYPVSPAPSYYAEYVKTYVTAIQPLLTKNILVVGASGNENIDMDNLSKWNYTYNPCMVPLANVLCVAATDPSDARAFFSNYGSGKVHIAAPGQQIFSTLWEPSSPSIWGPLNGTSMATPITSGAAALVASVLGAADGNYYKGLQVRDILMRSGDVVPGLAVQSSSRINAYAAVRLALDSLDSTAIQNVSAVVSATLVPASMTLRGWWESYWSNQNPNVLDTTGQTLLDSSFRSPNGSAVPTFSNFKYGSGSLVVFTSYLRLNVSGIHNFRAVTSAPVGTYRLLVNGRTVNLTSGTGSVRAAGAGWYNVTLLIGAPTTSLTLELRPPSVAAWNAYGPSYAIVTVPRFTPAAYATNMTLARGWVVHYNRSTATSFPNRNSVTTLAPWTGPYQFSTLIEELALGAGSLRTALWPGDTTTTAAIGYMYTMTSLVLPLPTNTALRVTCKGCQLAINGQVVIDNWESLGTSVSTTKASSCMVLDPKQRYHIGIAFTSAPLSTASMTVQYQDCSTVSTTWTNLPGQRVSPLSQVFQTNSMWISPFYGYIGGVQCDVWRAVSGTRTTSFPNGDPMFKVRLPRCASPETATSTCATTWSFTLDSILPSGLATKYPATANTFAVRCWTYRAGGFASGRVTVQPTNVATNVYLAGMNVWSKTATGAAATWAPTGTNLGAGNWQLLAAEWLDVTAVATLSVGDSAGALPINLSNSILPLYSLEDAEFSGQPRDIYWFLDQASPVQAWGVYSAVYRPNTTDVPALVAATPIRVSPTAPVATIATSAQGLDMPLDFAPAAVSGVVRYVVTEGYGWMLAYERQWYTFSFTDPAGSATTIHSNGVTLLNAPAYAATNAQRDVTFQAYVPFGWMRLTLVTKTAAAGTATPQALSVTDPGDAFTLFDASTWHRAWYQPQGGRRRDT